MLLAASGSSQAQSYTLSGYVEDAATRERLIGANLYDIRRDVGTTTNAYGFFSLTLPTDSAWVRVSYVGYRDTTLALALAADTLHIIRLRTQTVQLGEVAVTADPVLDAGVHVMNMPLKRIQELPVLLGEPDVLKAFQLTPGVQGGTEGTSGLYVRGGSPDQNLILLDGAPVYNVSHLFGFFSVFNTDAIQNVQLIKGGFPARYGGRLSSVVDITMKEGNLQRFASTGSIGLIASRLTVEGPLVKDRSSFIISGRRTYLDLITRPLYRLAVPGATLGYYFYDLNAKANYRFSDRDRVFVSVYRGRDRFYGRTEETFRSLRSESQDMGLGWGNVTTTARWTHVFGPKLFAGVTLLHSRYLFNISIEEARTQRSDEEQWTEASRIRYTSGLRDWGATLHLDYAPNARHAIDAGVSITRHTFRPDVVQQHLSASGEAPLDTTIADPIYAVEGNVYLADQIRLGAALSVNLGVHASGFHVDGRGYVSVQPRLSARYRLSDRWQTRAAFTTMRQYIHLLANSGVELPTDLWVPATDRVRPQDAYQVGLGMQYDVAGGRYALSLDGYFKQMKGVIAYKDGTSFIETGSDWQDKITSGDGRAYGVEVFFQKKQGTTTGWLGYTLAWARRQFDEINGGASFPYRYDRRHNLSLVVSHQLSERRTLSATWVYRTGIAVTLPAARYRFDANLELPINGGPYEYYDGRNGVRMRPYHRLDLAYRIRYPARWGEGELSFGFYNAYSRMNPFYMRLDREVVQDPETGEVHARYVYKEVGLVPVIPFISYGFTF